MTPSARSVMIMAGGTGGHVYPGLAVAKGLRARGWDVSWIGTARGLEATVVPANKIELHTLKTLGLRGKGADLEGKRRCLLVMGLPASACTVTTSPAQA
jgi:UDP-N-acetylglucosamine--N-acetylmuramyl-(pentapeptide) pyrophosphoryl-undecaprenol N-acetylglucosamine transferase